MEDELEKLRSLVGDAYDLLVAPYRIGDMEIDVPIRDGTTATRRVRMIDDAKAVEWLRRVVNGLDIDGTAPQESV